MSTYNLSLSERDREYHLNENWYVLHVTYPCGIYSMLHSTQFYHGKSKNCECLNIAHCVNWKAASP